MSLKLQASGKQATETCKTQVGTRAFSDFEVCEVCPPGRLAPEVGAPSCQKCPAGQWQRQPGVPWHSRPVRKHWNSNSFIVPLVRPKSWVADLGSAIQFRSKTSPPWMLNVAKAEATKCNLCPAGTSNSGEGGSSVAWWKTTYLLEKRFAMGESLFHSFATQWFDSGLHFSFVSNVQYKATDAQKASIVNYGVHSLQPVRAT